MRLHFIKLSSEQAYFEVSQLSFLEAQEVRNIVKKLSTRNILSEEGSP